MAQFLVEMLDLPKKPILLAHLTAIWLQAPMIDKQRLLEAENVPDRLARENALLMCEIQFLQPNIGAEFVLDSQQISFSAS